ncbi:MAG: AbrB/MazE/SpoVT family DNA-binding domain-containing protein [Desulfurococcaceae archaeon]|jgi:AbrB family looped-hinge helix DNA binding protein
MESGYRVRVSKKYTIYIPREISRRLNLKEGDYVRLRVEGSRLVVEPIVNPFDLALSGRKYAKITFEEFEKESEEIQSELFG